MSITYTGWWQVPAHLLPATALGELEFPRSADGQQPVAWVEARDWRDRKTSIALYDARACPPTKATARQLAAAAARAGRLRVCADCNACCQRPLALDPVDRRPLCPACRQVARLRARQAELRAARPACAARAAELLGWADAAVVQVDLHTPPPTPAGRKRPPTAAWVRAVDLDGRRLVDVLVRLVGPRAHHVPQGAVPAGEAAPLVHRALLGRRLLCWGHHDLLGLHQAAPHPDLPQPLRLGEVSDLSQPHLPIPEQVRAVVVEPLATCWRGQLDPHIRALVPSLPPGAPDRLALLLRRIATTSSGQPAPAGERPASDDRLRLDSHDPRRKDLMKLRLHGTPAECAAAVERLRRAPGLHVHDQSRPYPDRSGELVRVYLTVDLDPTSSGVQQPEGRSG